MITVSSKSDLREAIKNWRKEGYSIGFVPTMGNLHEGHLSLVKEAYKHADKVVASIFVNPTQFDRKEDLAAYPRTLEEDSVLLQQERCDLLFVPDTDMMYTDTASSTFVTVPVISELLEGASRPGHFNGVATIVSKLFNLVTPDIAVFGEKDFQQLMVIRQMVEELDFDIEIIGHPTARDADGLALSSRNGYLTTEERQRASMLHATLQDMKAAIVGGEHDLQQLSIEATQKLADRGFKPHYIEIRQRQNLQPATIDDRELVILASAWLGKARLIDNITVDRDN